MPTCARPSCTPLTAKPTPRMCFNGLVVMPTSPNIKGLPYHKDAPIYEFDLEKAKSYMQKAWDGKVWEKGFKMIIVHNTGNEMREAAAHMMAENIMSLNPKFQIEVRNVALEGLPGQIPQLHVPHLPDRMGRGLCRSA